MRNFQSFALAVAVGIFAITTLVFPKLSSSLFSMNSSLQREQLFVEDECVWKIKVGYGDSENDHGHRKRKRLKIPHSS